MKKMAGCLTAKGGRGEEACAQRMRKTERKAAGE